MLLVDTNILVYAADADSRFMLAVVTGWNGSGDAWMPGIQAGRSFMSFCE